MADREENPPPAPSPQSDTKLWPWMVRYARFVYDKPYWPISFVVAICVVMYGVLFFAYGGVHPAANTNYYRWSGDEITDRWDSYVGASQNTYKSLFGMLGETIPLPKQFQLTQMGALIYERPGQNMIDPDVIKAIWTMEDEMHATPGWADHCFKVPYSDMPSFIQDVIKSAISQLKDRLSALEEDTGCIAFKSIITDIKTYMTDTLNMSAPDPSIITHEFLHDFMKADEVRLVDTYFGNDYNNETMYSDRMRSMVPFGFPLKGYKNKNDRQQEQIDKLGKWQLEFLEPADRFLKKKPFNVSVYDGFAFAMNYHISDIVLSQVWWLVGSFSFLFVFAVIVMKTWFVSIIGVIGVFLPIPCAVCGLRMFFAIHHVDVIDVIGLFLICGIGADCLFIIFDIFRQAKTIYGYNNRMRLAYAMQRGLIALSTSISTAGVSFLALLTSGVRIMNFFGLFCFLLLFFTFLFTFTWFVGFLAIWAKDFEEVPENVMEFQSQLSTFSVAENEQGEYKDYPHKGIFDFMKHKPTYGVHAAGLKIEQYNKYEKFFHDYVASFLYFYRFPISVVFFALSAVLGYWCFQTPTKSELQFLPDNHPYQRAYTLSYDKFSTALNDFSFVYVWGLKEHPDVSFSDRLTIDQYGVPEFKPINIIDEKVQDHLVKAWDLIRSETDLIDAEVTKNFGVSPWDTWNWLFQIDAIIEMLYGDVLAQYNLTALPQSFPLSEDQYNSYNFLWQAVLSELLYEEPDSYVPGTLKADTIGFGNDDYKLKYIGMKANMKIPPNLDVASYRQLYKKAEELSGKIESIAPDGMEGYFTGVAWLTMVTEEKLPQQVVKDVALAFLFAAIVIGVSTFSLTYTILVVYSMTCTIFITMGILYFTGWSIGTNEAIMISIAAGFCADFIIQPMLSMAHDHTGRSLFGKLQASITTFASPVSSALVTTLVAASFLYPCEILLFPPFATFLLCSGIFGILHGFVVLPGLISLFSSDKKPRPSLPNFEYDYETLSAPNQAK